MQTSGILLLLVQIGFAVHALRRGYPLFWVFLIVFVPLIGCLLYIIMVLAPEFLGSRTAAEGRRALRRTLDPGKAVRECEEALATADTVANRLALAEAYAGQGRLEEAIALYERSLEGFYRTDPVALEGLARARVAAGRFAEAGEALDALTQAHPDRDSPALRLLRAQVLEGQGDAAAALALYAELAETAGGAEVSYRYGAALRAAGREAEARAQFETLLRDARRGNRHSQALNREWIDKAEQALKA